MPTVVWILVGLLCYGVILIGGLFWFVSRHRATGAILVTRTEGKTTYSLELDGDVDEILEHQDWVLFKIIR